MLNFTEEIPKYVCKYTQFTNINKNNAPELHVGFGADTNFTRPMGVCLTSITINNPDLFLNFHIFTNLFSQPDLERFKKTCDNFSNICIYIYKVDENLLSHLPVLKCFPLACYYRLLMPLILKSIDKVLYIDSDILCLNNIMKLTTFNLNDHIAAIVHDVLATATKQESRLKLAPDSYFNSGVMLINISEWLQQKVTEKAIALLLEHKTLFSYPDQDVLNIILQKKTTYLPRSWNHIDFPRNEDIPPNTILLHCVGAPKPWKAICNLKSQSYYLHYEKKSAWSDLPLELPQNYREARNYYQKLLAEHDFVEFCIWFYRFIRMRHKEKCAISSEKH